MVCNGRCRIWILINDYRDKFKQMLQRICASTLHDLHPSKATAVKHSITLIYWNTTIRNKMRRVPFSKRAEFKKMLDEMLEAGLIQKSESSWSSPVLLVSKEDGSIRFTVDFRSLNLATIKDAHPLPNCEDMFALLSQSVWYTKLDLYSWYYQIQLDHESRKYTAFSYEWGLYEYTVMPMGLTNAPATFQRMMNKVLEECIRSNFVVVFLDDILIHSAMDLWMREIIQQNPDYSHIRKLFNHTRPQSTI